MLSETNINTKHTRRSSAVKLNDFSFSFFLLFFEINRDAKSKTDAVRDKAFHLKMFITYIYIFNIEMDFALCRII